MSLATGIRYSRENEPSSISVPPKSPVRHSLAAAGIRVCSRDNMSQWRDHGGQDVHNEPGARPRMFERSHESRLAVRSGKCNDCPSPGWEAIVVHEHAGPLKVVL